MAPKPQVRIVGESTGVTHTERIQHEFAQVQTAVELFEGIASTSTDPQEIKDAAEATYKLLRRHGLQADATFSDILSKD